MLNLNSAPSWLEGMHGLEHVRGMHHLRVWIEGDLMNFLHSDLDGGVHTSEMDEQHVKYRGSENLYPPFSNAWEGQEGEAYWDLQVSLKLFPIDP